MFDEDTQRDIRALVAKGRCTALFFTTDDIHRDYEKLRDRGVEFVEEPTERPYGIDCGFRDPSGNHFRITQRVGVTA
jgi:predicted enzyme related to lactoylglutathione lyase